MPATPPGAWGAIRPAEPVSNKPGALGAPFARQSRSPTNPAPLSQTPAPLPHTRALYSINLETDMRIQATIEEKLQALEPAYLAVENESHRHAVPPNSETHFKVTLVSARFEGLMPVKRHQQIYAVLADELSGPVHALALHLYTPSEWEASGQRRPDSPDCQGANQP